MTLSEPRACPWCRKAFAPRRGGTPQRFCCSSCREAFWSALRRWGECAVAAGVLSLDQIRSGAAEACTLLPGGIPLDAADEAGKTGPVPVAPPERPGEAAADSPSTETWKFRAMVAEAVVAALVEAVPRIIDRAMTDHTS
jgi:hypothetical protein